MPTVLEACAGGGGQALGLEAAGFTCQAAIEIEPAACKTLRDNRPDWRVIQADIKNVSAHEFRGVDVFAAGVPCPPFSIAGKQLGLLDERDLFPDALRLVEEARPAAVLIENVPGLASAKFASYRQGVMRRLARLGYAPEWHILNASDFGVPQLRPRFVLVALRNGSARNFCWPASTGRAPAVGATLFDLMASRGWPGAERWAAKADSIAPTIVGGSKKHGGPDLGPTRARLEWRRLGVDGLGIADEPPEAKFPVSGMPRLTLRMVARIQGFPDDWFFAGAKTAAYRQVGNAFPPPLAGAVGAAIIRALSGTREPHIQSQLPLLA